MIRREFLQLSGATIGSGLLASCPWTNALANAATAATGNVILVYVGEGWDVTLSLDSFSHSTWNTEEGDVYLEYRDDDRVRAGNLILGPAAATMAPFANRIAIVNGIFVSGNDPGHDSAANFMRTGDGTGSKADLPVELARTETENGLGVLFNSSLTKGTANVLSIAVNELDLLAQIGQNGGANVVCGPNSTAFQRAQCELAAKRARLTLYAQTYAELTKNDPPPGSGGTSSRLTPQDASRIVAALKAGLTRFTRWNLSNGLDTHSNHLGDHLNRQKEIWTVISRLFEQLESTPGNNGGTMFDETTVVIVSEFARTPALNSSKGKDHNPATNSVLLAGAGLRTNQVVGRSRVVTRKQSPFGASAHVALPMDFANGDVATTRREAADPRFNFISPANVVETVRAAAGAQADRNKVISTLLKS